MASQLAIAASAVTMSEAIVGDSRSLPVEHNSVDLVLTSPPYCTRIDYVINTSFELAALGIGRDSAQFDSLRRASMGGPLVRKTNRALPPAEWPHRVRSLLAAIESHPSKASQSYYYKTYWNYFSDCAQALRELHRCLRPGATAVIVLQSSYYKDIYVDLPQLYCDMGTTIGFQAEQLGKVAVRRALAQINSRSMKHRSSTEYTEAIIALEKCA
jgi:DNA modification methylase